MDERRCDDMDGMKIIETECALAMVDVLGFKAKMDAPDKHATFETFLRIVNELHNVFGYEPTGDAWDLLRRGDVRVFLYSDTLVFFQVISDEVPACDALVTAGTFAARAITEGLDNGLLLRGSLSVGNLLFSSKPSAIAGPVINECAMHYELGQWVNCHLTPSAVAVMQNAPPDRLERMKSRFAEYDMPIMSETGAVLSSRQIATRWLPFLAEILPDHFGALYDSPLRTQMETYKMSNKPMSDAVIEYFRNRLTDYALKNPVAMNKVEATLKTFGIKMSMIAVEVAGHQIIYPNHHIGKVIADWLKGYILRAKEMGYSPFRRYKLRLASERDDHGRITSRDSDECNMEFNPLIADCSIYGDAVVGHEFVHSLIPKSSSERNESAKDHSEQFVQIGKVFNLSDVALEAAPTMDQKVKAGLLTREQAERLLAK